MTGVIRKATLLAVLGLVVASSALAGIPSPANSTIPAFIKVVGTRATVPDPLGTFTVTVNDVGPFPVVGSVVTLNFSACTDMFLCQLANVTCGPGIVSATTNSLGVATFTVVGGGLCPGTTGFAGPGLGCVTIRADGVLLGTATANDYDLNGALGGTKNGVAIGDLTLFMKDWAGGTGPYVGRSDFNMSSTLSIADLSAWMKIWGPLNSSGGCSATYCGPIH